MRLTPSFLICGGRRCGAGVLYRALAAHPALLAAGTLDYFDLWYGLGPRWYRSRFPTARVGPARAARLAAAVAPTDAPVPLATFEASAGYLYHPHAPARIAAALPDVKLLVVVRDPVTRAWSQHAHEVAVGHEWERDFGAALDLEAVRLDGEVERLVTDGNYDSFAHRHHAYRANGEYVVYLDALATCVDRDRILVVDAGRLRVEPQPVYDRVLEFLGLPNLGYPTVPRRLARYRGAAMDPAVRRDLTDHYEKYDARLVAWLGHQPSWRAEPSGHVEPSGHAEPTSQRELTSQPEPIRSGVDTDREDVTS
ncbi:MAG TPA: sulfotransferase domain-containing protein [Micromonosporaceae bacterium]